jgi:hypothetical protein
MQVSLPWNDLFPQCQIVVTYPGGETTAIADNSHATVEVPLPPGVSEDDVEILGYSVTSSGQRAPGRGPCVVKERIVKPKPEPTLVLRTPKTRVVVEPLAEPTSASMLPPVASESEPECSQSEP